MEELTSAMGSSRIESHQGDEVYHETQRRMWCALHSLNALLQEPAYDAAALTEIALSIGGKLQLAHRWPLMGNWDINVMMIAPATAWAGGAMVGSEALDRRAPAPRGGHGLRGADM